MDTHEPLDDRRFKPLAGMKLVYDPCDKLEESAKKHACPDCHFCQFCSDSRCHSCLGKLNRRGAPLKRKLSLCEQIQLYDEINARKE
jgi:hypothetical protein